MTNEKQLIVAIDSKYQGYKSGISESDTKPNGISVIGLEKPEPVKKKRKSRSKEVEVEK